MMKTYKDGRTHTEYMRDWKKDPENLERHRAAKRRWAAKNPNQKRNAHLLRTYGITLEDYAHRLQEQSGRCAICGHLPGPDERTLVVDHCHTTGKIRGLLCHACNRGIGFLQDKLRVVEAAAEYLRRSK